MSLVKDLIKAGGGAEKFFAGGLDAAKETIIGSERLSGARTNTINSHLRRLEKEFKTFSSSQGSAEAIQAEAREATRNQGTLSGASAPIQKPKSIKENGVRGVEHLDGSTSSGRPNIEGKEPSLGQPKERSTGRPKTKPVNIEGSARRISNKPEGQKYGPNRDMSAEQYEAHVRARAENRNKTKGFVGPLPEDISKRPNSPYQGNKYWTNANQATSEAAAKDGASFGTKAKDLWNNINRFAGEDNFLSRSLTKNVLAGGFAGAMGSAAGLVGSVGAPGDIEQNGGMIRGALRGATYGALLSAGRAAGGGLVKSQLGTEYAALGGFGKMTKGAMGSTVAPVLMTLGAFGSGFDFHMTRPMNPIK